MSTFVRHPDTSEMLPAEASGRMRPGDELVDINGHSVEGLNAEEATALIRQVCVCSLLYIDRANRPTNKNSSVPPGKIKVPGKAPIFEKCAVH